MMFIQTFVVWRISGPVLYGNPNRSQTARTRGAICAYRLRLYLRC